MPAVSVIIPTYNRAHCLETAIASVLAQDFGDFELIVSDDGSTDRTEELVSGIADSRIAYLKNQANSGAAAARNLAIERSIAPLIAFLDSDDIWLPGKLDTRLRWMQQQPTVLASFTDYQLFRESNGKTSVRSPHAERNDWAWDLLLYCRAAAGSTLLARREAFEIHGFFDMTLTRFEDWDWLLRLAFENHLAKAPLIGSQVTRSGHQGWPDLAPHYDTMINRWKRSTEQKYGQEGLKRLRAGASIQQATSAYAAGDRFSALPHLIAAFAKQPNATFRFCASRLRNL